MIDVTEGQIQRFVLKQDSKALTDDQLRKLAYHYLLKEIRRDIKYDPWSKTLKDDMASFGVVQNRETGEPELYDGSVKPWAARARIAEDETHLARRTLSKVIELAQKAIRQIEAAGKTFEMNEREEELAGIIFYGIEDEPTRHH